MATIAKSEGPTLEIRVVPDETAPFPEALVLLTSRDSKAANAPAQIVWKKLPASKKFQMVDLIDESEKNVFQNIQVSKKKVRCDFVPPDGDPSDTRYKYKLIIKYKSAEYDTDERGAPTDGRPVIRN
jgi:hypothetical protein